MDTTDCGSFFSLTDLMHPSTTVFSITLVGCVSLYVLIVCSLTVGPHVGTFMELLAGPAPVCSRWTPETLLSHPQRDCLLGQESSAQSSRSLLFICNGTEVYSFQGILEYR